MCGIAGWVGSANGSAPSLEDLHRMAGSLSHRGPDGDGFHLEGAVGLAHRRLAIIDVAGGDNPLHDGQGQVAVVFNGEIYNHRELRADLEAAGRRPATGSDGEVIVHGYLEWGRDGLLSRIRGMYAFALHDRRSGDVHLARDPFGIKPLFVHVAGGRLLFGSEIKAIVAALGERPALDPKGLLECCALGFPLAPRTVFAGVESLLPGQAATWSDGRLTTRQHHRLTYEPGREKADAEELWSRLCGTVDSHLMSEVPLGAFLSGGVDSSAVVAGMAEVCGERVDAVCVGIQEPGMDERPFARQVADELGVTLHEEQAAPELLELIPRLAWHLEMPFGDTSAAPTWLVCGGARRHVTVALSGDGGDEAFAGYRRTRYDVLEQQWRDRLPAPLRHGLLGPMGRLWPRGPWLPRPLRAGTLLENLASDWLGAYVRSLSRIREEQVRRIVRSDVLSDDPLVASFAPAAGTAAELDPLSRVLAMDMATWLPDDILVKADRMSMAHGLEVRVPLLDTDFVDWAAGLPVEAKLSGGQGKMLFRRSLRGRVPDTVLDRPKQGFHLPLSRWLRGVLGDRVREILAQPAGPAFDILEHHCFVRLMEEHQAERVDHSTELWLLLMTDAFQRHGPGGTQA